MAEPQDQEEPPEETWPEEGPGPPWLAGDEAVELPIDGTLDLHTFHPRDLKSLLPDYLEACRERGILEVRVVHGKGTGTLRRTVHSLLERLPYVVSYHLGDEASGSWGATVVTLRA